MLQAWLFLAGGFVLLIVGADVLVRNAARLGIRLGMRPMTVGATIVAFGTSAPEFVVSLLAALKGEAGIAIGNLVGSNIANIGLVLGLAALVRPIPTDKAVLRFEYLIGLLAALAVVFVARDGITTRVEGAGLFAGFLAFIFLYAWAARRSPKGLDDVPAEGGPGVLPLVLGALFGLGMLIGGSDLVVRGAQTLAEAFGFTGAAVGATLVAVGTSLPEVATSVVAAARGAAAIAVGNVLGSNVFNLLFVLGPVAVIQPLPVGAQERDQYVWIMVGITVLLLPMLAIGKTLTRLEGLLLLAGYGAFLWIVVQGAG